MSRLRTLLAAVVLATTALLLPATAASAATRLTATISCDPDTGVITTSVSGGLLAPSSPTPITATFQRTSGARVTATTVSSLPVGQPFAVRTTSNYAGEITAAGYTSAFSPTDLYYREKVVVKFTNTTTGSYYTSREATCHVDRRTTVTLTCDPDAATVTATVNGINGQGAGRPASVGYRIARIQQSAPNDPTFRSELLGEGYDIRHRVTPAADGTWSDVGYTDTLRSRPYHYWQELTVAVFDQSGFQIGGASTSCVLFDGSIA